MKATIMEGLEYGTDRPCEIGRLVYTLGAHSYVTLSFRYTDVESDWFLTWHGVEGGDSYRLPPGITPNDEMLDALVSAPYEVLG